MTKCSSKLEDRIIELEALAHTLVDALDMMEKFMCDRNRTGYKRTGCESVVLDAALAKAKEVLG